MPCLPLSRHPSRVNIRTLQPYAIPARTDYITKTKTQTKTKNATIMKTMKKETKVMCPVCGTEFAIGEHEHTVSNAVAVGKDSGLGDVYLPVSKRGKTLEAAGIDTSRYFSINLPTGGEQLMRMNDDGVPVAVTPDDPVIAAIKSQGTVPNRSLFRRWVMSQVFHGLTYRYGGFRGWLRSHGYDYQWKMLVEELRVQAKLHDRKDMENFKARNRWFNQKLAVSMAKDYISQMTDDANSRKIHKCKGVPYVKFNKQDIFVEDIQKKLVLPMHELKYKIMLAKTPKKLYEAVRSFWWALQRRHNDYKQCAAWIDAYKGMGAYATMQNLIRFHGCSFPNGNDFYRASLSDLQMLENAADAYHKDEGWRLFGVMKQMIEMNRIDIKAKMNEWREARRARLAK